MRTAFVLCLCVASSTGCAASLAPARTPPAVLVGDTELGVGLTHGARLMSRYSAGVGFESGECCGLGAYLARSYVGTKDGDDPTRDAKTKTAIAGTEITELGAAFTVVPLSWWRIRMRGGLAASPPDNQDRGRHGVAGGLATLFRVLGQARPQVGDAAFHLDLFADYSATTLTAPQTSAGFEGQPISANMVLVGARLSIDYGLDLR